MSGILLCSLTPPTNMVCAICFCLMFDSGARVQKICDMRVRDVSLKEPNTVTLRGKSCLFPGFPRLRLCWNIRNLRQSGYRNEPKRDCARANTSRGEYPHGQILCPCLLTSAAGTGGLNIMERACGIFAGFFSISGGVFPF